MISLHKNQHNSYKTDHYILSRSRFILSFLLLSSLSITTVLAADIYNYQGCYAASDIRKLSLTSKGSYTYQSRSYCEQQCPGAAFVALLQGDDCYCGQSEDLSSFLKLSASGSCTVPCQGWPYETCGGTSSMDVLINANKDINSLSESSSSTISSSNTKQSKSSSKPTSSSLTSNLESSSSSSSKVIIDVSSSLTSLSASDVSSSHTNSFTSSSTFPSSSSSSSSSSSLPLSSSTHSTTSLISSYNSASASESVSTQVSQTRITSLKYTTHIITKSVVTNSDQEAKTIIVTTTSIVETAVPSAMSNNTINAVNRGSNSKSKKLSGGAIAGIVVGVVVGTILIIVLLVFIFFYRRRHDTVNIEENKQYQPYSFGDEDANPIFIPNSNNNNNNNNAQRALSSRNNNSTPIIPNSIKNTWHRPTRNNTLSDMNNNSNSNTGPDNNNNNKNNTSFGIIPTTKRNMSLNDLNRSKNNSINTNRTIQSDNGPIPNNNFHQFNIQPTVFEEDPTISQSRPPLGINESFYNGNQRFSATSLPDMMQERKIYG
ncbi:Wsc2p NDAI_0A06010 [Naumovozyma dairenensis CBS 421]|uniref:WSC domain-containing protein n=1 Tax=Naumovozyma dairenensis (strain ATCC 10597 / BCRC 20456 / CBS 421 / NBRC 0211 / NRRL Y-12639) TaxID=1071378 RepID=G0W4L8_NAUDC|nr:hypothetical protein NDAI_0A06010 [Naumovozyma dairenensis CBS 421]CCD22756.1 hypothetical protein NDAI_0A06010 [Naumovozyma dairenensis CBS 421]